MNAQVKGLPDDLPLLAIKAAAALDAIKRGGNSNTQELARFMTALKSQNGVPTAQLKHLTPADAQVMTRAVHAYSGKEVSSIEELKQELQRLYKEAGKADLKDAAGHLMKFCIAFHDEFLDQKRILVSARRSRSPFRI